MLETSKDLLYIVIAFCILWFTIFICWMIYYMAMILKRIHIVMETFTRTLEAVRSFFDQARDKVNNLGSTIAAAVEVGRKVADFVKEKQANKSSGSRKKK